MSNSKKPYSFASEVGIGLSIIGFIFVLALSLSLYKLDHFKSGYNQIINNIEQVSVETDLLDNTNNIELVKNINDHLNKTKETIYSISRSNKVTLSVFWYTLWGLLIIGLFLFVLLGTMISRSVTNPLKNLVIATKKLAKGQINQDIQVTEIQEFEILSSTLNELINRLKDISNVTVKMVEGDYSQRVGIKSQEDILAITVNQMLENFNKIVEQANAIAQGNYNENVVPRSEEDILGNSLQNMTLKLRENEKRNQEEVWLKDGLAYLASEISGHSDLTILCRKAINMITRYIEADVGAIYVYDKQNEILKLHGSFALSKKQSMVNTFKLGQGIIGQVASEKKPITIQATTGEECIVQTGIISFNPKTIFTFPIIYENELIGVVELASHGEINNNKKTFLEKITSNLATQIKAAQQQTLTDKLLEEIKVKALELEKASAYKSEFLANMSHELRTPLNSLLILANLLADNEQKNLNEEQVEYAKIIAKSGSDLLTLINDILDLAKVEAGKIEIVNNDVELKSLVETIDRDFSHVAEKRGINFISTLEENLPLAIYTDDHRVLQIVRNLISNAIKFTEKGEVKFSIGRPTPGMDLSSTNLDPQKTIALSVSDTGIGISAEKQKLVFESFQQADGTTSRQYGGTGLGLSISKKLSQLLNGEIILTSIYGKGSIFTLCLPETPTVDSKYQNKKSEKITKSSLGNLKNTIVKNNVVKDSDFKDTNKQPTINTPPIKAITLENETKAEKLGIKNILIVDDDMRNTFALSKAISSKGYNVMLASNGKKAIEQLESNPAIDCVLMDIMMPVMDGYEAIKIIREKQEFKNLPIIALTAKVMSGDDEKCKSLGASDFLSKPIDLNVLFTTIQKWIN